jgi:hypothetical protein
MRTLLGIPTSPVSGSKCGRKSELPPEKVLSDSYLARLDTGKSQPSMHADPPRVELDDLNSLQAPSIFTRLFISAAVQESKWIRLSSIEPLTDETIHLLQYGGPCLVCSHGRDWLLHSGADTGLVVLLKAYHGCERYLPGSIRAHIKHAEQYPRTGLLSRST